jgi:hypothetical protein
VPCISRKRKLAGRCARSPKPMSGHSTKTARDNSRTTPFFVTASRACSGPVGLLALRVADMTDQTRQVVESFTTRQRKSGKPAPVHLSSAACRAQRTYCMTTDWYGLSLLIRRDDDAGRASEGAAIDDQLSDVGQNLRRSCRLHRYDEVLGSQHAADESFHSLSAGNAAGRGH